jgi:hypothetical protein
MQLTSKNQKDMGILQQRGKLASPKLDCQNLEGSLKTGSFLSNFQPIALIFVKIVANQPIQSRISRRP